VQATLTAALDQWRNETQSELYIILDQFEEYFQYHGGEQGSGTLRTELPLAISQSQLRIKFLISIRDDAYARLNVFKARIPNLFERIQQVRALSLKEARNTTLKVVRRSRLNQSC
jgi:hypothetical protein